MANPNPNMNALGKDTRFSSETAAAAARKSVEAKKKKKEAKAMFQAFWDAEIKDQKIAKRLKESGLPPTYGGQTVFNITQSAGKNSGMARLICEIMGIIKKPETNITVSNEMIKNPLEGLTEEELVKLARIE